MTSITCSISFQVVCRDLGHPGGRQLQGNSHSWGHGSGPIHMSEVSCSGSETNIFNCMFGSTNSCNHNEDVGVECKLLMYFSYFTFFNSCQLSVIKI